MKNLTQKQIEFIKTLKTWSKTSFHGNTKKINDLPVSLIKEIVSKKRKREISKQFEDIKTPAQKVRELLKWSIECQETGYFKTLIEGNSGIYYANPSYCHSDYNKSRIFDKNEKTLKLMEIFNSFFNKQRN